MANFLDRLLRVDERALKKIEKKADLVISYEDEMKALSDEELQAKTPYFKELLSQGKTLDEAIKEVGMVVEGVKACKAFYELKEKINVSMPITDALYNALFNGADPKTSVYNLMVRKKKSESL